MGATLAYINGGDPLSGGSSAVAAEKAAQYLAEQYNDGTTAIDPQTGEFTPNLLPEAVKEEITAITGAIAGVVGATGNNGAALNAQIGSVIGQNAVVNNDSGCTSATPLANCAAIQKSILDQYRKDHYCRGLSAHACNLKLQAAKANYGKENVHLIYEYLGDWLPVISTIKGVKEAQSTADYIFAAADIFPAAGKGLKISRFAFNKMVDGARQSGKWNEVRDTLSNIIDQTRSSLDNVQQIAIAGDIGKTKVAKSDIPSQAMASKTKLPSDKTIIDKSLLGANGTQINSITVWKGEGKNRIDVENPNPGKRAGQIHYQDNAGNKWLYNPQSQSFEDAPKSVNKLLEDKQFKNAIDKAMRYIGEE